MTSEHTCVTDDQHSSHHHGNFPLQELPNFLPESVLHTYSLSLSLRCPLCSHITVQFIPSSFCLSLCRSQPQGQRLFYIPSVISFLDRLKHKHYKGFTVTWPSRSWERKQFAEQLNNKSVITFTIIIIVRFFHFILASPQT